MHVTNVFRIWPNGTLRLDNGSIGIGATKTLDLRGTLQGRGNIDTITGVLFTAKNTGTLLVGSPIGEMVMNHANYTQTVDAAMAFEIGGAAPGQYGRLVVEGDMALAGFLRVTLTNDSEPEVGDLFDLMDWGGTLTGIMAPFLPNISPKRWVTRDLYHSGELGLQVPTQSAPWRLQTWWPFSVAARAHPQRWRR